jgi:hypothetical protein
MSSMREKPAVDAKAQLDPFQMKYGTAVGVFVPCPMWDSSLAFL